MSNVIAATAISRVNLASNKEAKTSPGKVAEKGGTLDPEEVQKIFDLLKTVLADEETLSYVVETIFRTIDNSGDDNLQCSEVHDFVQKVSSELHLAHMLP